MATKSAVLEDYVDYKTAKKRIRELLKEYGELSYSRLLLMSDLSEETLDKALDLLYHDKTISCSDSDDPVYSLKSSFWGSLYK